MLDSLKYAFAAISTALAGGYVVSQSIDDKKPTPKPQVPIQLASIEVGQDLSRNVTLNINGTFGDVVNWMKSQKINFVIADEAASKRRIALNFQNRPLKEVLNAIASAMGGSWQHQGDTMVFRSGADFFTPDMKGMKVFDGQALKELKGMEGFKVFSGDQLKQLKELENFKFKDGDFKMDGKFFEGPNGAFKFFSPDGKVPNVRVWVDGKEVKPEELKKGKIDGKDVRIQMGDGQFTDQMRKQIEQSRKEALKQLEMYRSDRKMSDSERKEMEAAMKEAREAMNKAMGSFDKAKIEKEIAEAMKHQKLQGQEFKGLSDAQRREIETQMKKAKEQMDKAKVEMEKVHKVRVENIRKLMDSLTPAQKDLAKKQGHLKLSDLTPAQRELLDIKGADDSVTMSYSIDGQSITIKGK